MYVLYTREKLTIQYNIQYKICYSQETSGEVWENLKTGGHRIVTYYPLVINVHDIN